MWKKQCECAVCALHIEQATPGKSNGIGKESCRLPRYSEYPEFILHSFGNTITYFTIGLYDSVCSEI